MTETYDASLVVLSFAIAVVVAYAALNLAERVPSGLPLERRLLWQIGGAIAIGSGIWAMHFVAMLAFQLPQIVHDDVLTALLSCVCGIGAASTAVYTINGITKRNHAETTSHCHNHAKATSHRSAEMSRLLSQISHLLIDQDLDSAIYSALKTVGEFLQSDRAYLVQYDGAQQHGWITYEWHHKTTAPLIPHLQKYPVETQRALHTTLLEGKVAQNLCHDLPPATHLTEAELTEAGLIQPQLAVPLLHTGKVTGFIGLEVTHAAPEWSPEDIGWLKLVSEFIALSQARQVAQSALQRSNLRYQNLADNVPGMIYQFIRYPDQTTSFLYASPGCREIFGMEPEALVGNLASPWKLTHPDDRELLNQSIGESARQLQPWNCIWRICLDQQVKWLQGASRPELQADGSIIWDGVVTDITERKQSEELLWKNAERDRTIAQVLQRMRQTLDLTTIFTATTEELRQAVKSDRVLIYRFNPDWSGELVSESVAAGWRQLLKAGESLKQIQHTVDQTGCIIQTFISEVTPLQDTYLQENQGGIYSTEKTYTCIPDIYTAQFDPCYVELLEYLQARAYIIVPIFCGKQLWGLLATYQNSSPRAWEITEIKMIVQIGTQLGVAIQQAELLAKTQQQAEELKQAKETADAANYAKSNFLASMSHELRTPLNAILGFAQLMHQDSSIGREHREYLDIISRSGEHLLKLINDVLEMSKIEAGRTLFNENCFDLHRLLFTLEEMLRLKAHSKGLKLIFECTPDVPQHIKTDESKLRQILINLLSNAIKFTNQGNVTLRVNVDEGKKENVMQGKSERVGEWESETVRESGSEREQDNEFRPSPYPVTPSTHSLHHPCILTLHFKVEDTGQGIAPDEVGRLFEPFEQTTTGLKSAEGSGLGLPISQHFVQLMGGKITVHSQLNVGSKFCFSIPVIQVEKTGQQAISIVGRKVIGLAPNQPQYRILVAEDNPMNRLLLVRLLGALGFELKEAEDGYKAIALWKSWKPHLIWMDMRMPKLNGYEVTRQIKASPGGQDTVIIALTASAFEEQRQDSLLAGCDDFVRKPFQQEELLEKLNQYLGVQYVYEEEITEGQHPQPQDSSVAFTSSTSRLQDMPETWIEQLKEAALQCNDDLIFRLIEEIPKEAQFLISTLTTLTENFQFDQILNLTQSQYEQ